MGQSFADSPIELLRQSTGATNVVKYKGAQTITGIQARWFVVTATAELTSVTGITGWTADTDSLPPGFYMVAPITGIVIASGNIVVGMA